MTRITFENVSISLTAPDARAAYDRLCALLQTPEALDADLLFCTDTYVVQPADPTAPCTDGPTSDLTAWDDDLTAERAARAEWEAASAQTRRDLTGTPDPLF